MRIAVLLLLMAALGFAFTVQADFIDVKDTGGESLETLDVSIFIDCDEKDMTVEVEGHDSEEPVAGADVYLFYTDYGYQPIKRAETGADGMAMLDVPGTIDYLTALFILRVDKSDYRSREIEFTYEKCFQEPPPEPEEPEEVPEEVPEEIPDEAPPVAPPENVTPPEDVSPPEDGPVDAAPPEDVPAPGPACPLGLAMLSLLIVKMRY